MCARDVNGSKQLYYWCSGTLIFLDCSSMLNAATVTNAFLSYNWLSKCFFSVFFFYILTTFLFYRLFDNVLMKTYSLCGRCDDKKAFKETKTRGIIVLKYFVYLKFLFAEQKYELSILSSISFFITNHKINNIFENILEFRQHIYHWNVLIAFGYW